MYDNLIVPFDGSPAGRTVLAPTTDLAWRCRARTIVVSNTDASERSSQRALKGKAESLSSPDIDFWVDHERSLGDAVLAASEHRENALICVAVHPKRGLVSRRFAIDLVAAQALEHAKVPVMVVGPKADVALGLPLKNLVVSLDGSAASERILPLATKWAVGLNLVLTLVGVSKASTPEARAERRYLRQQLGRVAGHVPNCNYRLLEGERPGDAISAYLAEHTDSIMMMSTHGRSGLDDTPLGSVAQAVLLKSPRPIVFLRPDVSVSAGSPPEGGGGAGSLPAWFELPE